MALRVHCGPGALGPGVDRDLAVAALIGCRERYPQRHRALSLSRSGACRVSSPDVRQLDLGGGKERQLQKAVPGNSTVPQHGVVGQPGVLGKRDATAEGEGLALGVLDRGGQEGVPGGALADAAGSADRRRARARSACAGRDRWEARRRRRPSRRRRHPSRSGRPRRGRRLGRRSASRAQRVPRAGPRAGDLGLLPGQALARASRRGPGRGRARGRRWRPGRAGPRPRRRSAPAGGRGRPSRRDRWPARRSSSSPVRLETIGISGAPSARLAASAPNSASIGSISGEWKAWQTARRLVLRLALLPVGLRSPRPPPRSPETTIERAGR